MLKKFYLIIFATFITIQTTIVPSLANEQDDLYQQIQLAESSNGQLLQRGKVRGLFGIESPGNQFFLGEEKFEGLYDTHFPIIGFDTGTRITQKLQSILASNPETLKLAQQYDSLHFTAGMVVKPVIFTVIIGGAILVGLGMSDTNQPFEKRVMSPMTLGGLGISLGSAIVGGILTRIFLINPAEDSLVKAIDLYNGGSFKGSFISSFSVYQSSF